MGLIVRILIVHFFELSELFGQFYSFKSKTLDNRPLFEFHQSEVLNVRDDKTIKNLCFPFIRSQSKKMTIKDLILAYNALSRNSPVTATRSIIVRLKANG
jgi:hypothetical protein